MNIAKKIIIANSNQDDGEIIYLNVIEVDSVESLTGYIEHNIDIIIDSRWSDYTDENYNVDWVLVANDIWNGRDVHYESYECSWAFRAI